MLLSAEQKHRPGGNLPGHFKGSLKRPCSRRSPRLRPPAEAWPALTVSRRAMATARFAADFPQEEAGFELSVPPARAHFSAAPSRGPASGCKVEPDLAFGRGRAAGGCCENGSELLRVSSICSARRTIPRSRELVGIEGVAVWDTARRAAARPPGGWFQRCRRPSCGD